MERVQEGAVGEKDGEAREEHPQVLEWPPAGPYSGRRPPHAVRVSREVRPAGIFGSAARGAAWRHEDRGWWRRVVGGGSEARGGGGELRRFDKYGGWDGFREEEGEGNAY